ncbi:unnamed protein product, partial [Amoebophrya sp. A25]
LVREYVREKRRTHAGLVLGKVKQQNRADTRQKDPKLQAILNLIGDSKLLYQAAAQYLSSG